MGQHALVASYRDRYGGDPEMSPHHTCLHAYLASGQIW